MRTERYEWLDSLRGIAIILVIAGHVIGGLDNYENETFWKGCREVI